MTYFGFLLRFLVIPIILLLGIQIWQRTRSTTVSITSNARLVWIAILIQIALALTYTTPWDNYLVATGVWHYNPGLVTGILLGYVPLEEYTFFIIETLFVGLWWWLLSKRLLTAGHFEPSIKLRTWSGTIGVLIWLISIYVFSSGWKPGTYLSITLLWAMLPISTQLWFGADILWHHRKLVIATILPMGLYLSLADALAIYAGIWTIDPSQSTRIILGNLPIEEAVFFLLTVILIGFGLTLSLAREGRTRFGDIWAKSKAQIAGESGHKPQTDRSQLFRIKKPPEGSKQRILSQLLMM